MCAFVTLIKITYLLINSNIVPATSFWIMFCIVKVIGDDMQLFRQFRAKSTVSGIRQCEVLGSNSLHGFASPHPVRANFDIRPRNVQNSVLCLLVWVIRLHSALISVVIHTSCLSIIVLSMLDPIFSATSLLIHGIPYTRFCKLQLTPMRNFCLTKLRILMIGNLSYRCSIETVID